jgi:hypothetical protein
MLKISITIEAVAPWENASLNAFASFVFHNTPIFNESLLISMITYVIVDIEIPKSSTARLLMNKK